MKTEKQKMLYGELYKAFDAKLVTERNIAKEIIHNYNQLRPSQAEDRKLLIKNYSGLLGLTLLSSSLFIAITATTSILVKTFLPISIV